MHTVSTTSRPTFGADRSDSVSHSATGSGWRCGIQIAALAMVYVAIGKLSVLLAVPTGHSSVFWPAAGIGLFALLRHGYRLVPGIFFGAFALHMIGALQTSSANDLLRSCLVAGGVGFAASSQALLGAYSIKRWVGYPCALLRGREVARFLGLGGPMACLLSATLGTASLYLSGSLTLSEFPFTWWIWWIGDCIGVIFAAPLLLLFLAEPRPKWRRRMPTAAPALMIVLATIITGFVVAGSREQQRLNHGFERRQAAVANVFSTNIGRDLEILRSIQSLFASSGRVGALEFKRFVSTALDRASGIQRLSWNPRVRAAQRSLFEASAGATSGAALRITERDAAGALVAAGDRDEYIVVHYVEPHAGGDIAVGFDVASDPVRRAALDEARDTAAPTATARISLPQASTEETGVLVFMPIYEGRTVPDTVNGRRAALLGYAVGEFNLADLMASTLAGLSAEHLSAYLLDDSANGEDRLLAAYHRGGGASTGVAQGAGSSTGINPPGNPPSSNTITASTSHDVAGRQWRMVVGAGSDYLTEQRSWGAWMVFVAGLLLSGVTVTFVLTLTGRTVLDENRAAELAHTNASLAKEVRERARAERALAKEKERAEVTLYSIGDGVITTDRDGRVETLNPTAELLLGLSQSDALGLPLDAVYTLVEEESRQPVELPVPQELERGATTIALNGVLVNRTEQEFAIEQTASQIRGSNADIQGMVVVFKDVTDARRMSKEAAHFATHDALTDLVNRREFDRRVDHAVNSAKSYGIPHTLCYLDLDQFKIVNDTVGHGAGDELLQRLAVLLTGELRERDTLARLGGDEFGLLLDSCPPEKGLEIARRLVERVRCFSFVWQDRSFEIGVSVGLVAVTKDVENASELLARADVACYAAKEEGRNRVHVYSTQLDAPHPHHSEIIQAAAMHTALEQDRFELFCQPIVSTSDSDDRLAWVELLIRLKDENGRLVPPGMFIPGAERYGLMESIDRWVIQAALDQMQRVHRRYPDMKYSINLSGTSLGSAGLLEFVRQQFQSFNMSPELVCFEITETAAVTNMGEALAFISELKDIGCKFALDDFGTGLSSFSYLKTLPVDYLKIDGTIVRDIARDTTSRAMVNAINEVAHTMKIATIAEYAETEEALQELRKLGVDFVQGFAVGSPETLEILARIR